MFSPTCKREVFKNLKYKTMKSVKPLPCMGATASRDGGTAGKIESLSDGDDEPLRQELEEVKAERAKLLESSTVVINKLREELTENTGYYAGRLNEAGATIGTFKDKLALVQARF
jgi:hypothetical protein